MNPDQKKGVTISIIPLILLSFLIGISCVPMVSSQNQWEQLFGPAIPHISIYDNGAISSTILPIERIDNLYYLTGDIYNYAISIYCDNIVLDGRNFSIKSNGSLAGEALSVLAHNVTIQNFIIDTVPVAVSLYGASGNMGEKTEIKIVNNTIRNCNTAINCWGPSANSFKENVLENNKIAIKIKGEAFSNGHYFSRGYACFNSVEKNIIKYNNEGLHIEDANQSSIRFNLIAQNGYGASLNDVEGTNFTANEFKANTYGIHIIAPSSDNQFLKNNFESNSEAVTVQGQNQSKNSWDNGSMGNYWSDYGGSGVYIIDENNIDHSPVTTPVDIYEVINPTTDRNAPHLDPIVYLIPVCVIVAVVMISLLLYRRHRKTAKLNQ